MADARARLADLGRRIAEAMARHGFSERELLLRHIKREVAVLGIAKTTWTFAQTDDGTWKFVSAHGAP